VPETQPMPEKVGGKRGGDQEQATSTVMAGSPAAGAQLVGPVGTALAHLASVVESAPAATTASAA
jgi:hypothetical protein